MTGRQWALYTTTPSIPGQVCAEVILQWITIDAKLFTQKITEVAPKRVIIWLANKLPITSDHSDRAIYQMSVNPCVIITCGACRFKSVALAQLA